MKYDKFINLVFVSMFGFCVWFLKNLNTNVDDLRKEVARSNTWIEIFRDTDKRHDEAIAEVNRRVDVMEAKRAKKNAN